MALLTKKARAARVASNRAEMEASMKEKSGEGRVYEPPKLEVLGDLHELTEGPVFGTAADTTFPHVKLSGT